jgi:hypothetical protein
LNAVVDQLIAETMEGVAFSEPTPQVTGTPSALPH